MATLRFLDGAHAGQVFVLTEASVVIGNRTASTIVCKDPGVAPNHAAIVLEADGTRSVVERQGPALVNGCGAPRTPLRDGDILIFAVHSVARFEVRTVVAGTDAHLEGLLTPQGDELVREHGGE